MKIQRSVILAAVFALFFSSCNQGEGLGGSSSIEGYVYEIVHLDDDFTFQTNTFPAVGTRVYLSFGDDGSVGKDMRAGVDGYYRFDYLREGKYKVYALSEIRDGERRIESQTVKIGSGKTKADTIHIHSGKAYGTAMIRGYVVARYLGAGGETYPATNVRAFIRLEANIPPNDITLNSADLEDLELKSWYFDDVHVADGVFIFQKLLPGRYVIAVASEDRDRVITLKESEKVIEIKETDENFYSGIIYDSGIIYVDAR